MTTTPTAARNQPEAAPRGLARPEFSAEQQQALLRAAAWLSLRELFAGGGRDEGSKAPLHLQGTWDDPIVVAAEE